MTKVHAPAGRQPFWWAVGSLLLAGILCYADSLSGPFIFDDLRSIPENATIRHLWGWWHVFTHTLASGDTVGARPLLNLSFAINYFFHRRSVWGYHVTNLLIHLSVALVLFGVVLRTLRQPLLEKKYGRDSLMLAWAAALLWEIHPLLTEGVTYTVQRAESLVSLLYLLTLYCFCRAVAPGKPDSNRWLTLSFLCALLGTGVKEVIVSAPVVVLLYDRTFISGSFGAALRRRKFYYLALACTWFVLAGFIWAGGDRSQTVGNIEGVSWLRYALTEFVVLLHYLRLVFWPHPLVLIYGNIWINSPMEALPGALVILPLVALSAWTLFFTPTPSRRWPAAGLLGCFFFLILSPTSTVVPLADAIFEHRMYLPLSTIVIGLVLALYQFWGSRAVVVAVIVLAPPLMVLTVLRNWDYHTAATIWGANVAARTDNYRTRNNLGLALSDEGRFDEALVQYRIVEQLKKNDPLIHCNIGVLFDRMGRYDDARKEYDMALHIDPFFAEAYSDRGVVLAQTGHLDEALADYEEAVKLSPKSSEAERNLGVLFDQKGDVASAVRHYQRALRLNSDNSDAHSDLGEAYGEQGKFENALAEYAEVLRLDSLNAEAHYNRGVAFTALGRIPEAIDEYRAAVKLKPGYARAKSNLRYLESKQGTRE